MRPLQLPTPRWRPHNLSATPPNARRDANSLTVSRVLRMGIIYLFTPWDVKEM